jgi:L-asparagine transporter-like permease
MFIFSFTLLFVYDYFPNILFAKAILKSILIWLTVGLLLFNLIFKRYRKPNKLEVFKRQLFSTFYILFLIGLFTILGGESSTGLSLNNVFFWIVFLLSSFEMFSQWKKVKDLRKQQTAQKLPFT